MALVLAALGMAVGLAASAQAAPLTVMARARLDLRATPSPGGLSVSGRLTDDAGRPVAGRTVRLAVRAAGRRHDRAAGSAGQARVVTDADGGFDHRFELSPGRWRVGAAFDGESLLEGVAGGAVASADPAAGVAARRSPSLEPRRPTELALRAHVVRGALDDTVHVTGRLASEGRPLAGHPVVVEADGWDVSEVRTDGGGRVRLAVGGWRFSGRFARVRARYAGDETTAPASAGAVVELPVARSVSGWLYGGPLLVSFCLLGLGWLVRNRRWIVAALARLRAARPSRAVARGAAGGRGPSVSGAPSFAPDGTGVSPSVPVRVAVRDTWHSVAAGRAGGPVWGTRTPDEVLGAHGQGDVRFSLLTRLVEEVWYSPRPAPRQCVLHAEALADGRSGPGEAA